MTLDLVDLHIAFPERAEQIKTLASAFASPTSHLPFPLFIHGPEATGKTSVLQLFHEIYQQHFPHHSAFVSCSSVLPLTLFFRKILQQWHPSSFLSSSSSSSSYPKIDTMLAFVREIQSLFPNPSKFTRLLILDNAEELLSSSSSSSTYSSSFFQALLKLSELTHQPIVLVFISSTVWSLFTRLHPSLQITFPPYTSIELISIYQRWQPTYDPSLVVFLVNALVDTLHKYAPDLIELHALLQRIYPPLAEKVHAGLVSSTPSSLFRAIQQALTQSPLHLCQGHLRHPYTTDLPLLPTYLVLASYIASHNPSKWDTVYFHTYSERKRPRGLLSVRTKGASKGTANVVGKVEAGGTFPHAAAKWVPFERLVHLFGAITKEQVHVSMDLLPMAAKLVAWKYLLQYKSSDVIQPPLKFKCNVSFSFANTMAQSIGFDLRQCLHQPSAY